MYTNRVEKYFAAMVKKSAQDAEQIVREDIKDLIEQALEEVGWSKLTDPDLKEKLDVSVSYINSFRKGMNIPATPSPAWKRFCRNLGIKPIAAHRGELVWLEDLTSEADEAKSLIDKLSVTGNLPSAVAMLKGLLVESSRPKRKSRRKPSK